MQKHHIGMTVVTIGILVAGVAIFEANRSTQAEQEIVAPVVADAPQPTEKPKDPNMQPKTPPALTELQTAELAAGEAAHEPTNLTFNVSGGMFYYVPNVIKVKKEDTVTINFLNDGGFHDFTLDEFGVKIGPIKTGEIQTTTFVADKVGSFEYYCNVGSHRAMGQVGTLIVEE